MAALHSWGSNTFPSGTFRNHMEWRGALHTAHSRIPLRAGMVPVPAPQPRFEERIGCRGNCIAEPPSGKGWNLFLLRRGVGRLGSSERTPRVC